MSIATLPLVFYALHLAITGDFLLLALILASGGIMLLPRFFDLRQRKPPSTEPPSNPGVFDQSNQIFLIPPPKATGDISLSGPPDICYRFLRQLFRDSTEEIWCLGQFDFNCHRSIYLASTEAENDLAELVARSKVSLPFTLLAEPTAWNQIKDLPWAEPRTFRVILVGEPKSETSSELILSVNHEGICAVGNLGADFVDLIARENLSSSQPADDFRNERASSSGSFDLISQASGKHRPSSGDKSERFNFPIRRLVVDKTKSRLKAGYAKDQIGERFAGQVGSANTITDIATRLRQLGHGI